VIDLDTRLALVNNRPVGLTEKEYGIIELLSLRKGTTKMDSVVRSDRAVYPKSGNGRFSGRTTLSTAT
jgi:hypothetical protein